MKVLIVCLFCVFLLLNSTVGQDTVAEDIGVHQQQRLVEMLTFPECEELLSAMSQPEDNIFQHIDRLSPDKNKLDTMPRAKRSTVATAADEETRCRTGLTNWLQKYGEKIYYDRLFRALQHIGRPDIANEVGKNINQEKVLSLRRYVENYHKFVESLNPPSAKAKSRNLRNGLSRAKKIDVRDLTGRNLDLIVTRVPIPPYQKGPSDVAVPILVGFLVGFVGAMAAGVSLFVITDCVSRRSHLGITSSDSAIRQSSLGQDVTARKSQ
ncbi:unnamed protein product [Ophioblennius macclurei]